jgi:hypothetical protein
VPRVVSNLIAEVKSFVIHLKFGDGDRRDAGVIPAAGPSLDLACVCVVGRTQTDRAMIIIVYLYISNPLNFRLQGAARDTRSSAATLCTTDSAGVRYAGLLPGAAQASVRDKARQSV